ncbi:Histidine kinase-like ATPase domain-containing protein [Amycolatopsis pretoriensis]|uniref:Histidine kinase-like ATPase domain-containing protein n=1 Tax=Amycolatopsis pretoriensis TaxID=218821 RepID=A0A1H5RDD5_9PSEU|nr:Histidine kinase-like ATPase domain-containing protein [Amycolatopsis pretoriensis]
MRVSWNGADQAGWQVLDVAGVDRPGLTTARRWAEAKLGALRETDLIDTLIVVGELLENAFVHGGGPRQLRIHHAHDPCEVTVAVADDGTGEPKMRVPDHGGGRGLLLVDQLSLDWGVSHHDDGKLVWARVGCEED